MLATEAAAIAVAVFFGLFFLGAIANFKLTIFRIYLLVSLSCVFRLIGYSFNAAYFSKISNGEGPDVAYYSVFFVLSAAGTAIAFVVHILIMTCWFKNATPEAQPWYAKKINARIAVRFIIAPFIIFGPILGITYVSLFYGSPTPSHLETANTVRHAVVWGSYGACILISAVILSAVISSHTSLKASSQDRLVFISFICACLLFFAFTWNVVALYYPNYVTNPDLYYPLIVLPALIEQLIVTIPRLIPKIAMASNYDAFFQDRSHFEGEKKLGGVLNLFKTFKKKQNVESDDKQTTSDLSTAHTNGHTNGSYATNGTVASAV